MAFVGVIRGMTFAAALAVTAAAAGCNGHSSRGAHRSAGQGGTPAGALATWGAPVLSDDFNGTQLDAAKWQVYEAPDASTHRGIAAGTHVSGGRLSLVGG